MVSHIWSDGDKAALDPSIRKLSIGKAELANAITEALEDGENIYIEEMIQKGYTRSEAEDTLARNRYV